MKLDAELKPVNTTKDIKARRDFLLRCLDETEDEFRRILSDLAEADPKFFMKVWLEMQKLAVPRQQDVNVSVTLNQDFQELEALCVSGQIENGEFVELEPLGPPALESQSGIIN